jgi:hypothetical protein
MHGYFSPDAILASSSVGCCTTFTRKSSVSSAHRDQPYFKAAADAAAAFSARNSGDTAYLRTAQAMLAASSGSK